MTDHPLEAEMTDDEIRTLELMQTPELFLYVGTERGRMNFCSARRIPTKQVFLASDERGIRGRHGPFTIIYSGESALSPRLSPVELDTIDYARRRNKILEEK